MEYVKTMTPFTGGILIEKVISLTASPQLSIRCVLSPFIFIPRSFGKEAVLTAKLLSQTQLIAVKVNILFSKSQLLLEPQGRGGCAEQVTSIVKTTRGILLPCKCFLLFQKFCMVVDHVIEKHRLSELDSSLNEKVSMSRIL